MASNPFLDAINFNIPQGDDASVATLQQMVSNMPSEMHGANLAPLQMPWNTSPDFIKTMASYTKTPSTASPQILSNLLNASRSSSNPNGGGMSFLDRLKNAVGQAWNETIGKEYNAVKGLLEGATTIFHDQNGNFQKPDLSNPVTYIQPELSVLQGALNPQQESQKYNAMKASYGKGVLPWAFDTALDTFTEPLSYLPIGGAAKALGKATGVPKLIGALKQSAPEGVRQTLNAVTSVFKPISGARQPFLNAVSRMVGKTQSGTNAIMKNLQDIFKGTTSEQRVALTHALESTAPGTPLDNPVLESLRQQVEPLLEQATQQSLARGLINSTINPADYGVARYIPHVNVGKLDENAAPFADITRRNPTIDASKSRNLEGTIQAINGASGNKVFEDDLAKILAYHLGQINKASTARDLIDEAMQHGLPVDGAVKAGDQFPGTFQKAVEYTSPHTGETVLLPESEANYLKNLKPSGLESDKLWGKAYKGTVNSLNRLMFLSSPFVHILNNLGTQTLTHAPGVFLKMPKYMKEAWKGVEPGSQMDQALQSGALHLSSILHGASTPKQMANTITKTLDNNNGPLSFLKSIAKGYSELTPRVEQAYRAAAFEHALEQGMTPDEAANWIRSMYGGRIAGDAVSPFEKTAAGFMPFYNWTKTAITSNIKNAANNPFPYVAGFNALNNYNQQETGHGMLQNPNPLSIALPWTDKNGNPEYYAPYAPPFDVAKLGKAISDMGLRGIPNFIFNRTNPLVRYGTQAITGEQNPATNPNDKFFVSPYPSLPSSFNTRGAFFGDKGPQLPAYVGQLLQDISNPLSIGSDVQDKGLRDTLITQLLGGSISAPNPASQQKEQQYQQNQMLSQFKSYLKKHAGGQ